MSSADNKQREWKPASIKVYAGEGRVPLEIMPLLKDPGDELGLLRSHTKRLEFQPDVYPPHWDVDGKKDAGRKKLTEAIMQAAGKADVALVLSKTYRNRNPPSFSLVCNQGIPYRAAGTSEISKTAFDKVARGETKVKENVKNSRMVNHQVCFISC